MGICSADSCRLLRHVRDGGWVARRDTEGAHLRGGSRAENAVHVRLELLDSMPVDDTLNTDNDLLCGSKSYKARAHYSLSVLGMSLEAANECFSKRKH